jgi:hypothetical protein
MAADSAIFRLNGVPFSATSVVCRVEGVSYEGFMGATVKAKRERKVVHATRQDGTPLGLTSGIYSIDSFSWKLLASTANLIRLQLTALGFGSYGDANFTYQLQISEPVPLALPPILWTVSGCVVTSDGPTYEAGNDELVEEWELMATALDTNGMQLSSVVRGLLGI